MLANLRALFVSLIDIIFLRRGPETVPASQVLLAITLALYFGLSALMFAGAAKPPEDWALRIAVSVVVTLLCYRAALTLSRKLERFTQTMTAVFGVSALFAPALIPVTMALLPLLQAADKTATPPFGLSLLAVILGTWVTVVQARIVRAAFEWPWIGVIVFLFGQELLGSIVYVVLFAPAPPAG